jgi:hypothetical protein
MTFGGTLGAICTAVFVVNKDDIRDAVETLRYLYLFHDGWKAFRAPGKPDKVIGFVIHLVNEPFLDVLLKAEIDTTYGTGLSTTAF